MSSKASTSDGEDVSTGGEAKEHGRSRRGAAKDRADWLVGAQGAEKAGNGLLFAETEEQRPRDELELWNLPGWFPALGKPGFPQIPQLRRRPLDPGSERSPGDLPQIKSMGC